MTRMKTPSAKTLYPFVGVDGEGGRGSERHEYTLLRAGARTLYHGLPLTPGECFNFLCSLPEKKLYVAYFFNYDVTMMCRDLPPDVIRALVDRDERQLDSGYGVAPVRWGAYEFDWLPSKEFKIRRSGTRGKWTVISDVGTFFQQSFVKAIQTWNIGAPAEHDQIKAGKDLRSDFTELTNEIIEYNALEIKLLEQLMEEFRRVCIDIGYVPVRWQGPGSMAATMFKTHGVPQRDEITRVPDAVWAMAQAAYYGGRFETTAAGWIR